MRHKKDIGAVVGLYPTPVTVIGTMVNDKINWVNVAHVGILGMKQILVSVNNNHYSTKGLEKEEYISVNLIQENILEAADYVGMVSGKNTDKSNVFRFKIDTKTNVPIIEDSPLTMICKIDDSFKTSTHNNWILTPISTLVEKKYLDGKNKIDFEKMSPILFDMQKTRYLKTGNEVAKCWDIGKNFELK